ncbi:MAG: phosphate/phosphite/phosphonate ABC transporter substrate-binding protein [Gammaproteobacteria bacterium]|nr:phosphate/phosphite/phosphonate ABC transporter substrate-binding protein [Gammaproteobacteria bacterium]
MLKMNFKRISVLLLVLIYPLEALSDYLFTAPPRESPERGAEIYKPIADFLTKSTGERFIYKQPSSWAEYSQAMQNKEYDLVFDGPHFVSWRIEYIQHDVLAKLPQLHIWRVIVRADAPGINNLDDLVGKKVCAPKSPNFGMLTMMSHYTNPEKEPIHIITKGWKGAFNAVVEGKCVAAVIPKTNHRKFDPDLKKTKALHTHLPYPNQAFTAGAGITPNLKSKIAKELLSPEGQSALSHLRDRFTRGALLVSADNEEYEGISMVLKRADNFRSAAK